MSIKIKIMYILWPSNPTFENLCHRNKDIRILISVLSSGEKPKTNHQKKKKQQQPVNKVNNTEKYGHYLDYYVAIKKNRLTIRLWDRKLGETSIKH